MTFDPYKTGTYTEAKDQELREQLITHWQDEYIKPAVLAELMIRLRNSIEKFDKASAKQTRQMIWLTWILVVLTVILAALTFIPLIKK